MTVRHIVELAYLNVTGGEPSGDASVMLQDIKAIVPAAVNYVLVATVWEDKKDFLEDLRFMGFAQDHTHELAQMVQLSTTKDTTSGFYYATLPKGVLHLPGGKGFKNAYSTALVPFIKASSIAAAHGVDDIVLWGFEGDTGHGKIWLKNLGDNCDIKVELVYNVESLGWDDEVPVPGGKQMEVLSLLEAWFRKQRHEVKDYMDDSADDRDPVSREQRYPQYRGEYQ